MRAPSSWCRACRGVFCSCSSGADKAAPTGLKAIVHTMEGPVLSALPERFTPFGVCSFGGSHLGGATSLQQGDAPKRSVCQSWVPERWFAFGGSVGNSLL